MTQKVRINVEQFSLESFPRPGRYSIALELPGPDQLELSLLLVRGAEKGKCLVVSAAVHGDEYEGVRAILDLFQVLDPAGMSGDLLAVVAANPPAFWAGTRTSPLDSGNLARVFPGRMDGGPTERLAYWIDCGILPFADLYVDLHSGGVKFAMPILAGYFEADTAGREAALAFGCPVVWGHPSVPAGRTVSSALARGIPCLYVESPGGGRVTHEVLAIYIQGLLNLLRYLEILPGSLERVACQIHLSGDGDIDAGVTAAERGILVSRVSLLESVSAGQELGFLYDLDGAILCRLFAPRSGLVVLIHAFAMVLPGEPLFLISGTMPVQ